MGKYIIYVMVKKGNGRSISGTLTNTGLSGFIPFNSFLSMIAKINRNLENGDFFRSEACSPEKFNRVSMPKHDRFFALEIYSYDCGKIKGCYHGAEDGGLKFFVDGLDLIRKLEGELNK